MPMTPSPKGLGQLATSITPMADPIGESARQMSGLHGSLQPTHDVFILDDGRSRVPVPGQTRELKPCAGCGDKEAQLLRRVKTLETDLSGTQQLLVRLLADVERLKARGYPLAV
jgi:hypothetical protein